jgi:hypothetical protein
LAAACRLPEVVVVVVAVGVVAAVAASEVAWAGLLAAAGDVAVAVAAVTAAELGSEWGWR